MTVENSVRALAGSLVLISLLLAVLVSQWWLLLTTFVGFSCSCLPTDSNSPAHGC